MGKTVSNNQSSSSLGVVQKYKNMTAKEFYDKKSEDILIYYILHDKSRIMNILFYKIDYGIISKDGYLVVKYVQIYLGLDETYHGWTLLSSNYELRKANKNELLKYKDHIKFLYNENT